MNQPNGKIEFIHQYSDGDPKVIMTLSPETPLPQLLEAFEMFLRASGYSFNGIVDIVETEYDPKAEQN